MESLEIQSKAPMTAELYKKIRDHPSLRNLDIHLDGDILLYRKPFLPKEISPFCIQFTNVDGAPVYELNALGTGY